MVIKKLNLMSKLSDIRNKDNSELMLHEVGNILKQVDLERNIIKENLKAKVQADTNNFIFDLLETQSIYHISQIKQLCIDYRLRFLDTSRFKNDIPEEAISMIRAIEKQHNTTLKGFKIIAPSKLFRLETYDDPILMAPIGNGYYYFIHKWGNDLSVSRKWLMKPFKNISNFIVFLFILSIVFTLFSPITHANPSKQAMMQFVFFLFSFKSFVGVAFYLGIAFGKNFSDQNWNSKYI